MKTINTKRSSIVSGYCEMPTSIRGKEDDDDSPSPLKINENKYNKDIETDYVSPVLTPKQPTNEEEVKSL